MLFLVRAQHQEVFDLGRFGVHVGVVDQFAQLLNRQALAVDLFQGIRNRRQFVVIRRAIRQGCLKAKRQWAVDFFGDMGGEFGAACAALVLCANGPDAEQNHGDQQDQPCEAPKDAAKRQGHIGAVDCRHFTGFNISEDHFGRVFEQAVGVAAVVRDGVFIIAPYRDPHDVIAFAQHAQGQIIAPVVLPHGFAVKEHLFV